MSDSNFWRTEVWHPLMVHFPIALLLFATLFKMVALVIQQPADTFWQRAAAVLLYFGCLGAWVSIYTGNMADGIVSRNLCDPTVLKQHEIAAYNLAYLFSAATVLDLGQRINLIRYKPKVVHLIVALLMLAGTWFLIRAGHSGAKVVYEQAGGVLVPTTDCAGF